MCIALLLLLKPEAGDYSYTGMHDHGPLPAPKEGGDFALLIGCVQQAKQHSDAFMTDIMKNEKLHSPPGKRKSVSKKPKLDS